MSDFKNAIEDMAKRSLRCVAIAYRPHQTKDVPINEEELSHWQLPEEQLILLAIVGIKVLFCHILIGHILFIIRPKIERIVWYGSQISLIVKIMCYTSMKLH